MKLNDHSDLFQSRGYTSILNRKLFEPANVLKCKHRLHDLIESLCLFSDHIQESHIHFAMIVYICSLLTNTFLYFKKLYAKILENFLKFYEGGPLYLGEEYC